MQETIHRCGDCGHYVPATDAAIIWTDASHARGYVACIPCEEKSYGNPNKAQEVADLRRLLEGPTYGEDTSADMGDWLIEPEEKEKPLWLRRVGVVLSIFAFLIVGE